MALAEEERWEDSQALEYPEVASPDVPPAKTSDGHQAVLVEDSQDPGDSAQDEQVSQASAGCTEAPEVSNKEGGAVDDKVSIEVLLAAVRAKLKKLASI